MPNIYIAQQDPSQTGEEGSIYITQGGQVPGSALVNIILQRIKSSSPEDYLQLGGADPHVAAFSLVLWLFLHGKARLWPHVTVSKEEILRAVAATMTEELWYDKRKP